MFSRIKAWGKYVLKIFKPCGISSLSEVDSVIPTTTGSEYMSTAAVATMDSMMTPTVAESSIIQAPQSSVYLPNDPDRIHNGSAISVESVPIATIHKTRSDIPEAANPIALTTETSASDMVISGCQTQEESIKARSAKIKEPMDSGLNIAKELGPIKDFSYDNGNQFTFTSRIAIDGVHDVLTKCTVAYDKNRMLRIRAVSGSEKEENELCAIDH
ncbi:hypothetical protein BASA50_008217 [Batrachochytrium salamandrivorans]|uniref:Uncharacterized protein n=1 Tax=Batrachochytrium salamandrivorans TaxID=1357716 RepID=A0ABQ8F4R7_9FUNG|nr:hypothetical protein BASA50_008217 [Batrachochytrium salamandrivorans]